MSTSYTPKLPLNISGRSFVEDKVAAYHWMLEHRPVCPATFSMLRGHLVCRYADCEMVLKDERFRRRRSPSSEPSRWAGLTPRSWTLAFDSMINKDDPEHGRLRKFISAAFTPRTVKALAPGIESRAHRLLDSMEVEARAGRPVDLVGALALPLPAMVIGDMLGVDESNMETFVQLIQQVVRSFRGWGILRNLTLDIPRAVRFLDQFIEEKRASLGDDLISELIRVEAGGDEMTNDELVSMVLLLIIGGFETTTHLIASTMVTLCAHPEALASVREDPAHIPAALEEVLRFASPVFATDRMFPTEEVTLHGVTLKPGDMVIACVGAANRDPRAFERPDVFDIHRRPNRHLGFGMGAHYCIGASLARLEARVAVEGLLERFDEVQLAVPPRELEYVATAPLNAYAAVPLTLE